MERIVVDPRPNKGAKLEEVGLSFHGWDAYWNEDVCYKFTAAQVDEIEAATNALHGMCIAAVKHVIDNNRFAELQIPEAFWEPIRRSFNCNDLSLYGRFDFAYDGVNPPKMLEYNADTPTSLLESAVAQWYWLEEKFPLADQFNSIHDKMVERWKLLPKDITKIYFTSLAENEEDWVCTHYLMETAIQAGYEVEHLFIEDLGYDEESKAFVDLNNYKIEALFKLYPWEWMMREEFGLKVIDTTTHFIEPLWKSLLANKGILAILWELFPDHENLLPAYFDSDKLTDYAKKPFFSREGANIELYKNSVKIAEDVGPYGSEGYVYQQLVDLRSFQFTDGETLETKQAYPVIGSWIVGNESAGMCIREDVLKITTNMSNFIPHYFE